VSDGHQFIGPIQEETQKMAKNAEDGQEFIKEDGTNKPKEERLTP
jgi:hypothetical protein